MKPVRVLIVDDSATMRALIRATLAADTRVSVVGEAANPLEAREAIKALNPDVMTLDVEMPHMNGLEFLEKVMRLRPLPVIMVSSLPSAAAPRRSRRWRSARSTASPKPSPQSPNAFAHLADKVKSRRPALGSMRGRRRRRRRERRAAAPAAERQIAGRRAFRPAGGDRRLDRRRRGAGDDPRAVPARLRADRGRPSICRRRSPRASRSGSTASARRACTRRRNGAPILPGNIYVAPGTHAHLEVSRGEQLRCVLREGDWSAGHRPSVDALFHSVARNVGAKAVGVILTGMGGDGAQGLLAMRKAGARTLGQNEATCVVYGMPKVAYQIGAVEKQAPLQSIAAELAALTART